MANSAARLGFEGLLINNDKIKTIQNTVLLASNIASKNLQLTKEKSNLANDKKINDGRANVPTKVFSPFASMLVMIFNLPAI